MRARHHFYTCVLLGLLSAPAAAQQALCFYADYDYQGAAYCPTASEGDIQGALVDKISAVRLPPGTTLTLYRHPGYTGAVLQLTSDASNLSTRNFNNLTASYRLSRGESPLPSPDQGPVCFYEDYDYKSTHWCTTANSGDITDPGVLNKISAVSMPAGKQVRLFAHAGLGGQQLQLTQDTPNLSALGFNNLAASFLVSDSGTAAPQPEDPGDSPASDVRVLMIGNSFIHGNFEPTYSFNASHITDLNGSGMGGVPGIFKQLTVDAGLSYEVYIESVSGQTLAYHYQNKLQQIGAKGWDVVVLQEYSTLDPSAPLNPASLLTYSSLLEQYVHAGSPHANPAALVFVLENWPRADQLYQSGGVFYGKSVEQAAQVLDAAYQLDLSSDPKLTDVIPVGNAFAAAITTGVAIRNPYTDATQEQLDVWNVDHYHASTFGSFMEALTLLGGITAVDPRTLGSNNATGGALGLTPNQVADAERLAAEALHRTAQK